MNLHYMTARRTALLTLSALGAWVSPAAAQEAKVTIDASVRARIEGIEGQFRPSTPKDDVFVSFRTMVSARVDVGALTVGGELLDARGYGERKHSSVRTNEIDTFEPIQLYAALHTNGLLQKGDTATVTGGRYSLNLGASRLIGRTDFPNTVNSYLGGYGEWKTKGKDRVVAFWGHPFSALPDDELGVHHNEVELDRAGKNLAIFGLDGTAAKAFGNVLAEGYVFRLAEQDRVTRLTRNRHLYTAGGRLQRPAAKSKVDFEVEAAYQWGTARATTAVSDRRDLDVRAGFVHAEAGWTFPTGWTPRVSVMFDYASGDGKDAGTYGRFDTLFGARRADFGPVALYGPLGRANIVSPGVRFEAKPSKRFDMMAAVRPAWLAEATDSFASTGVRDRTGASGSYGGTQIEARARRWLMPEKLRLEAGAAYLAKGAFLNDAPNAPKTGDTKYGYVDLSVMF